MKQTALITLAFLAISLFTVVSLQMFGWALALYLPAGAAFVALVVWLAGHAGEPVSIDIAKTNAAL